MSDSSEFVTPLMEGAGALKELFDVYVEAGFTEQQALQILIGIMRPAPAS